VPRRRPPPSLGDGRLWLSGTSRSLLVQWKSGLAAFDVSAVAHDVAWVRQLLVRNASWAAAGCTFI